MKEILIGILGDAFAKLERQVPQTKKQVVYVNIDDVAPLSIPQFMQDNGIPDDASIGGKPNGYDSFDEVCLIYDIDVPTTEKDRLAFKRKTFTSIVWYKVFHLLTGNGYKRVGFNSGLLKQFDDTTIYDMYVAQDFDRLVKYYSLYFVPDNQK